MIWPFVERDVVHGMSFGLSGASYDVPAAESVTIHPGEFILASTVERFCIPNDVLIVAQIIDAIDEAIRLRDKVLLILSEGAIASDWVEGEGLSTKSAHAMRSFLFPVRIDNAVMQTSEAWARLLRGQRNIGDFTRGKNTTATRRASSGSCAI